MNSQVKKILVMGCGSIGLRHLSNLEHQNGLQIAAYDIDAAAKLSVEEMGPQYRFFERLHDAENWCPDLVIVATPNQFHKENTLWAFSNNAHVLCEKPLAMNMDDAVEMVSAASENNKILAVGYTQRYQEAVQVIIDKATNGELGNLIGGRAMIGTYTTLLHAKDPAHRVEQFGSLLVDYTHELDILAAIFGDVEKLECFCNNLGQKELKANPSLASSLIQYKNGAVVSVHMDYVQFPQRRLFEIYGDKKSIYYNWQRDIMEIYDCQTEMCDIIQFNHDRDQLFIDEHRDIISAVKYGTKPMVTGEEALRSLKVAEMAINRIELAEQCTIST